MPIRNSEPYIISASTIIASKNVSFSPGAIFIVDGKIKDIGDYRHIKSKYSCKEIKKENQTIIPTFVNAHTHLELTDFPKWKENSFDLIENPKSFIDWIINLIKVKRYLSSDLFQNSIEEGILQSIKSGTSLVGDIVTHPEYGTYKAPLTGRLFFEVLGRDDSLINKLIDEAQKKIKVLEHYEAGLSPHARA